MMKKEPKCSVCPDDVKSIPKNLKKYQVGTRTFSDPIQYEEATKKYKDSLDLYIHNNYRLQNLLKLNKQAGATNKLEYSSSIPKVTYESAKTIPIDGSKKYKKLGEDFESLEHHDIDPIDSWKLTELYDKYKAPSFIKKMGLFDSKEEGFVDYGLVYKKPVQLPIFKKAEEKKQQPAVKPTPPAAQEKKVEVVNPLVVVKKFDTKGNLVEQDTVSPTSVNKRFDSATKTWKQKLQLGGDLKKYQVGGRKTPISTMVEGSANSRIGTENAFTEEGSRLINSYAGGLPNDTSYIYHNPSESYFYNTNRGAPIENRLFANPNTSKEEYIKKVNSMIPKYQEGGPVPASHADSVLVMNNAKNVLAHYDKMTKKGVYTRAKIGSFTAERLYQDYKKGSEKNLELVKSISQANLSSTGHAASYKKFHNISGAQLADKMKVAKKYAETKDPNKAFIYDLYPSRVDVVAPPTIIDKRIEPQHIYDYEQRTPLNNPGNTPPGGSITGIPGYDPLAVTPWDMLTAAQKVQRKQIYGNVGTPSDKKVVQPPIDPEVVAKQKLIGVTPDGVWGKKSEAAWQEYNKSKLAVDSKLDTSNWEQSSLDSLNLYNSTTAAKEMIAKYGNANPLTQRVQVKILQDALDKNNATRESPALKSELVKSNNAPGGNPTSGYYVNHFQKPVGVQKKVEQVSSVVPSSITAPTPKFPTEQGLGPLSKTTKIPNSTSFAKSQGSYNARGQKRFNVKTRQWEEIPEGWFNKGEGKGIEDLPKRQLGTPQETSLQDNTFVKKPIPLGDLKELPELSPEILKKFMGEPNNKYSPVATKPSAVALSPDILKEALKKETSNIAATESTFVKKGVNLPAKSTLQVKAEDSNLIEEYAKNKAKEAPLEKYYKKYTPENTEEVLKIQQMLVSKNYDIGKFGVDGKFGEDTAKAYKAFQKDVKKEKEIDLSSEQKSSVCGKEGCAEYVSGVLKNKVLGDAWEMKQNIENSGGSIKYNIYEEPELKAAKTVPELIEASKKVKTRSKATADMFNIGDVVGIVNYDSNMHSTAIENSKGGTKNTHVGVVTGRRQDGTPIVSHNIHKKLHHDSYNDLTIGWVADPNTGVKYDSPKSSSTDFKSMVNAYAVDQVSKLNPKLNSEDVARDIRGIFKTESGTGTQSPDEVDIKTSQAGRFLTGNSYDLEDISVGPGKIKLNSFSPKEIAFLDLSVGSLKTMEGAIKAATYLHIKNLTKMQDYADKNPHLGLTKEDVRNAAILGYNQGMGRSLNLGYSSVKTEAKEVENFRKLSTENSRDISSTKFKHVPLVGQLLFDKAFPKGYPTYVQKVRGTKPVKDVYPNSASLDKYKKKK